MAPSTKFFLVIGFMFIFYITMNGHLEKYLQIIFGTTPDKINIGQAAHAAANVASAL